MIKISPVSQLRQEILSHELEQIRARALFKEQLRLTVNSLQPVNLIKSAIGNIAGTPDLKTEIVNAVVGTSSGFLLKKIIVAGSHNPVRQVIATLLQIGLSSLVSNKTTILKPVANRLFKTGDKKANTEEGV